VRPDGSERILHAEGRVVVDPTGSPVRMMGTGQDITDRRRAEDAVRSSEERLRSTIETANDAFVAMDEGGVITEWNRQAEATFGWSRDEAVGLRLTDTIMPARHRR